jgi:hypothetical protein
VRVITNKIESKRRVEDEEIRRSRLGKLQQEALASAKANAAIEMKWAELLDKVRQHFFYFFILDFFSFYGGGVGGGMEVNE